jgi:hypothetical protein
VTTLEISGASARRERKRKRGERGREREKERERGGRGGRTSDGTVILEDDSTAELVVKKVKNLPQTNKQFQVPVTNKQARRTEGVSLVSVCHRDRIIKRVYVKELRVRRLSVTDVRSLSVTMSLATIGGMRSRGMQQ